MLFFLLGIFGCGVKGDPVPPESSSLPSLLNNYPDIKVEEALKDQEKNK